MYCAPLSLVTNLILEQDFRSLCSHTSNTCPLQPMPVPHVMSPALEINICQSAKYGLKNWQALCQFYWPFWQVIYIYIYISCSCSCMNSFSNTEDSTSVSSSLLSFLREILQYIHFFNWLLICLLYFFLGVLWQWLRGLLRVGSSHLSSVLHCIWAAFL